MTRLTLLDRDGVINQDLPTGVTRREDFCILPGVIPAIVRLCQAGHRVAVCTNQANLGRGLLSPADLAWMHAQVTDQVTAAGGHMNDWFVCPHDPATEPGCPCRKPAPGLLRSAVTNSGANPKETWFVGDAASDVAAANAAGVRPLLVATGKGQQASLLCPGVPLVADLAAAVNHILKDVNP